MIKTILVDFSRVVVIPRDRAYSGSLNAFYRSLTPEERQSDFFRHFQWNAPMVSFLDRLKGKFPLILFTTDILQNDPAIAATINKLFERIISASDTGWAKDVARSYTEVARELKQSPGDVLFIDDQVGNVAAAREAGMTAIQYGDHEKFLRDVAVYLSS